MKPSKKAEKIKTDHVKVVTNHRLSSGDHNSVFPQHVGESHWHNGARNGHGGSHTVKSKGGR